MIKTLTLLKRSKRLSEAEFRGYWRREHAPLVLELPGVRGYIQSTPVLRRGAGADVDGVAEVWYEGLPEFREALESRAYQRLLEDEANFMGAPTQESVFLVLEEDRLI